MSIKVLLVDDHNIMREGLKALLGSTDDIEVVAEAATGKEALQHAVHYCPDVIVMDISMPDLNGIDATRQVRERAPGTKILALSMHSDKRMVAGMLSAGASGYLLKDGAFEEIARAIRAVAANRTYLSPGVTDVCRRVMQGHTSGIWAVAGPYLLTSTDNGATWQTVTSNTGSSATTYTVTGLTDPGPYLFRVAAVVNNVVGAWTVLAGSVSPMVVPRAASSVVATPGNGQVALTWTVPADGGTPITAYRLSSSTDGTTWLPVNSETAIIYG